MFKSALLLLGSIASASAAMRGAWIPVQSAGTPAQVENEIKALSRYGVTDVFVDVYNNGRAYFPSHVMAATGGPGSVGPDLLGAAIGAGNALGIRVHAWLEYGLMAGYGASPGTGFARNVSAMGWTLGVENNFLWLDARKPAVAAWLCEFVAEAGRAHAGLASVQLDDHFGLPSSLAGTNTRAMTQLAEHLKTCAGGAPLTLSPATLSFAKARLNVDWSLWLSSPVSVPFTHYFPQIYRTSTPAFRSEFAHTTAVVGAPGPRWSPGVRVSGSPPTPWGDVAGMLSATRSAGAGEVIWYSQGITSTYASQFCSLWGCDGINLSATLAVA